MDGLASPRAPRKRITDQRPAAPVAACSLARGRKAEASPAPKRKQRGRGPRQMRASIKSTSIELGPRVASEDQRTSSPREGGAVAAPPAPIRAPHPPAGFKFIWLAAIQYIGGARAVRGSLGKPPLLKRVAAAGLTRLRDPKSANRRWLFLTRFAAAASRLVPNDSLAILSRSIHDSPAMHSRCTHDALATFLRKSLNPPKRVILQVRGEKPRRPPQLSPRASKSVAAAGGTGP